MFQIILTKEKKVREKLTLSTGWTTGIVEAWGPTSDFRFVHQDDNRFVLQQLWMSDSGKKEWRHINVVPQKEIPEYKALNLPFTKTKRKDSIKK
jgi:hypothetical protein